MAKKMYDIVPPKVAKKLQTAVKNLEKGSPKRKRAARVIKPEPVFMPRAFPKKELFIGGAVVVLLLAVYFYGGLARATVEISPKTETLSFQEKVSADTSYENVNLLKKVIPARILVEEKQGSDSFPATGNASNEGRATGTIKVYNKISPAAPLTLKVGTHFLSDGGKYFVSLSRIVVPASKGGVAGSIEVRVQAEESGDGHNIGPSNFSVPGLAGTAYYYSIWAESKTGMSGGYSGSVKKVTAGDLSSAKTVLTTRLLGDAETELRQHISQDEVVLDGAFAKTVAHAVADAKEGAVVNSFNETASVKVSALVFKKADIQKFAKLDAQAKLEESSQLLEESLDINYTQDTIDMQAGIAKMNLRVSATSHAFIDNAVFIDSLAQKTAGQIQEIIIQHYGADALSVKVKFWPFWVTKAPKDKNKVKIKLNFE